MNHTEDKSHERLLQEVESRQRNTIWPEVFENARRVDEVLWKGAPNLPAIQRIGLVVFGIFFFSFGICFMLDAIHSNGIVEIPVCIFFLTLGMKITYNGFRKNESKN